MDKAFRKFTATTRALRHWTTAGFFLLSSSILLTACSESDDQDVYVLNGMAMGTQYTITLIDKTGKINQEVLSGRIAMLLENLEAQMSTYRDDSQLSLFNQHSSTDWYAVSEDIRTVVTTALEISELTEGAFDITVGPLVNLWGFGSERFDQRRPSAIEITSLLDRVGYEHILSRAEPPAIRKNTTDVYVDLSAIAKGYAVDQVAALLDDYQISNYLVEIGGELRARGLSPRSVRWTIAIERPVTNRRDVQRIIRLGDIAVATSGNYRNYFEHDGIKYSHLIDPRTGLPVRHLLASVTVIDDSATYADAMATALLVLGPKLGFELASKENLAALFIIPNEHGFSERSTTSFDALAALP